MDDRYSIILMQNKYLKEHEGPWTNEPGVGDTVFTSYKGRMFHCQRNFLGAWCGYVEATPQEAADSKDLHVHGGVTFAGDMSHGRLELKNALGSWIGFDCNHALDMAPLGGSSYLIQNIIDKNTLPREAISELEKLLKDNSYLYKQVYRTLEYAQNECRKLIDQLEEGK